ncbi:hypothetical protein GCM10009674_19030 [Nesterenkonia xinjiangensis]
MVALLLVLLAGLGWGGARLVDTFSGADREPASEQAAEQTAEQGAEQDTDDGESEAAPATDADADTDTGADTGADADTDASGGSEPSTRRTDTQSPEEYYPRVSDASFDPDSIHVLVNRLNPLEPLDYQPDDLVTPEVRSVRDGMLLREEPSEALVELFEASDAEGLLLTLTSAYRSHGYQQTLYDARAAEMGVEGADEYTARPGHSEHQTGLAADVIAYDNASCGLGACFGDTAEGIWLAENAHRFGFIIRYQEGSEDITGYAYEPWHLRYVGVETAEAVHEEAVTLEEFWDEPPAPEYPSDEAED